MSFDLSVDFGTVVLSRAAGRAAQTKGSIVNENEQAAATGGRKLGKGAKGFLGGITVLFLGVGAAGGVATFVNLRSALGSSSEAASVVLVGEGAVLVASLVCVGLALLGQAAPAVVRAALWLLPLAGSAAGAYLADGPKERVVFALSPLAMAAGAEGVNLIARRVVAYRTGRDVNAEARNAALVAAVAFQQGRAANHPLKAVKKLSALRAWSLAARTTVTDTKLVEQLAAVHGQRLTVSADAALASMLPAAPVAEQDDAVTVEQAAPVALDEPLWGVAAVSVRDELAALPASVRTGAADQVAEVIRLDTTSGGITSAADVADRSGGANLRAAEPKFTDEELMAAGRKIMAKLDPPRTQNRFFAAMRAEGFKGSRDRLTAVHKAVKAELEADERADEQDAA